MRKRTYIPVIILLVAAAGLLILAFAFKRESKMPDEEKLYARALEYSDETATYYYDAIKCNDNVERTALLEKALESCNKAIELLYEIEDYYESHGIEIDDESPWRKLLRDLHMMSEPIHRHPPP